MNLNALQQAARALVGAAKDVNLRADPATPAITPVSAVRDAAQAPSALVASGGPAAEALRAQVAARGSMLATVVTALGGSRYLINVDGEDTPVVLNAAALRGTEEFTPGMTVRLVAAGRAGSAEATPTETADASALSEAGRLLASRAGGQSALDPRTPLDPANITHAAASGALVAQPDAPEQLARSIARTITESGLFYESHLADWVTGQRPIAGLQREPQLRWSAANVATAAAPGAEAQEAHQPSQIVQPSTSGHDAEAVTAKSPTGASNAAAEAAWQATTPDARAMVREQLQALSSQWVAWRGELWPGQNADIQIGRDAVAATIGAPETWRARLAVTLPTIGRVDVGLSMTGTRLDLTITGDSHAHASRLAADRSALLERLQAQGLMPLARFAHRGTK